MVGSLMLLSIWYSCIGEIIWKKEKQKAKRKEKDRFLS